jgi:hydrogenase maturation protein HypF
MREFAGLRFDVRGIVQGVGFRPWIYRLAVANGLTGRVWNHTRGVTIEVFGPTTSIEAFRSALAREAPPAAKIHRVEESALDGSPVPSDFAIISSHGAGDRDVSIPPDLATCAECFAEIADAAARRHRYPFTNCTNCGPRFTIALDVPYDRAATTMAGFAMCDACRAEYEVPIDRRFHAQPIACPACGPHVRLRGLDGAIVDTADPFAVAGDWLRNGLILAVKGLGGYLLACDATASDVVARLRRRKHREEKPFAVMTATLDGAERLAHLDEHERALLTSTAAPIVLCEARDDNGLAPEVTPGTPLVGLFLAYTPLHRLLLESAGCPLVMTSGNVSEQPLAFRDDEALERLGGLADAWLQHDREIAAPCDDSVVRIVAGAPMVMRRARGYVPRAIPLASPLPCPVLGCGALLKNTFCLAQGDRAWIGPHVGDLDNLPTTGFFEEAIERLERFTRITPEVFAHDLHPDLHSTLYAQRRGPNATVAVQHHHAHVAAVMAEYGLEGPVLGLAFDGTGYGPDGSSWGGEFLIADARGYERFATFRPLPLAGGDRAVHDVWRLALALVLDAFGRAAPLDALAVVRERDARDRQVVEQMLSRHLNVVPAHGLGRYFDAFGSLVLNRPRSSFEGQVAVEWNHAADLSSVAGPYPYDVDESGGCRQVDLRETTRAVVLDLIEGVAAGVIASRFHGAVIDASADVVRRAAARHGRLPVVLSGGCFQNRLLTEGLLRALGPDFQVFVPREVPPGDGGISLGQVVVAGAR